MKNRNDTQNLLVCGATKQGKIADNRLQLVRRGLSWITEVDFVMTAIAVDGNLISLALSIIRH